MAFNVKSYVQEQIDKLTKEINSLREKAEANTHAGEEIQYNRLISEKERERKQYQNLIPEESK